MIALMTYSNEGVMRVSNGAAKVSTHSKNFARSPRGTPSTSPRASIGMVWPISVTKLKVPFSSAASTMFDRVARGTSSSSFLTIVGVNALAHHATLAAVLGAVHGQHRGLAAHPRVERGDLPHVHATAVGRIQLLGLGRRPRCQRCG